VPVIHISTPPAAGKKKLGGFFAWKRCQLYTFLCIWKHNRVFYFCVKKVPVIHISTLRAAGKIFFFVKIVPVIHISRIQLLPKKRGKKKQYPPPRPSTVFSTLFSVRFSPCLPTFIRDGTPQISKSLLRLLAGILLLGWKFTASFEITPLLSHSPPQNQNKYENWQKNSYTSLIPLLPP
jgi:hypothetical protein